VAKAAEIIWTSNVLGPGSASPVVDRGRVYTINSSGVLICGDAATGEAKWKLRLKGQFWATPILAGERLYIFNQDGLAQVVQIGDTAGEIIGGGDLGDRVFGTPVVDGGAIYVRSDGHLWKFAGQ